MTDSARGLELPKGTSCCPMKPARADLDDVRNLAYLALCENDQSSVKSRICEMRRVGILRGVSSIRLFLTRRLVVPHTEHRCEGTPLFFCASGGFFV